MQTQPPTRPDSSTPRLLGFTLTVLAAALFLQRFGLPAGTKSINVAGPIGLLAGLYGVARGTLSFSPTRLFTFVALCFFAACGLLFHAITTSRFAAPPSAQSLAQFLIMTSFATLSFTYRVPERRFFAVVNGCIALVAVAGLLEFAAQFAGLRLFSFRGIVPDALLFEDGYNVVIPMGIRSLLKSNGFFLLEPSIFSQFMALGVAIELLVQRRPLYLALFAAGLFVSASGTGWLVLISFVVSAVISMGKRGLALALATIAGAAALIVAVSLLAPDLAATLGERLKEVTRPGTSGHLRFITPFWVLADVLARENLAGLFGLGAGVSEHLSLPYEYDVNTPVKIAVELGLPALAMYVGTVFLGSKTAVQRTLILPALVLLMFTGGYQQFPPVLFPILLIISIAQLEPEP